MSHESHETVESAIAPGVSYEVVKMSFARRLDLMRKVRDLARRAEFAGAGGGAEDRMESAVLRAEIDGLWVKWGLRGVTGLVLDGADATPATLAEAGPEDLFREALRAVRKAAGLEEAERKN